MNRDPLDRPDTQTSYRESTYVARPGESTRVTSTVIPERSEGPDEVDRTDEIRVEIEETRVEMGQTIEAIQEKLSPDAIAEKLKEHTREAVQEAKDHAKDAVREATVGKAEQMVNNAGDTAKGASSTIIDTIKENPIPAALAALSIGWLFRNRTSSSQPPYRAHSGDHYWRDTATGPRSYQGAYQNEGSSKVGDIASTVGETAGQVRESAAQALSSAGDRAGELASSAGDTAKGAGSTLVETIRENPIPSAMVGVGLTWLWMNSQSQPARHSYQPRYDGGYAGYLSGTRVGDDDRSRGRVGETLSQARGKLGETTEQAQEKAGEVVDQAQEMAGQMVDQAQYRARRARGQFEQMLEENPLGVAALAIGVGAAVGFALPETPQEHQLMGSAKESFMEQAGAVAQQAQQKVQRVAEEAKQVVQEQVQSQAPSDRPSNVRAGRAE